MPHNYLNMVFILNPKPHGTNQAITNNAVAASKLSNPLCLIIEVYARRARKKQEFRSQKPRIRIRHTKYQIRDTRYE